MYLARAKKGGKRKNKKNTERNYTDTHEEFQALSSLDLQVKRFVRFLERREAPTKLREFS